MRTPLLFLAVAACGGSSKSPVAPGDEAEAVVATPCPDDAAVLELGAQAWPASTDV